MNRPFCFLAFLLAFVISTSAHAQMKARELERIEQGKITKNEAQHLVQNAYPGAKIKRCELRAGKPHSIWAMEVVKPGEKTVIKLQVDGSTGKILQ